MSSEEQTDMEFREESEVDVAGRRREFVLREPKLGHYEEFAAFFRDRLRLTPEDLARGRRLYFETGGGRLYELAFTAGAGAAFPSGLELHLLLPGAEPVPAADAVDGDVWIFLRWLLAGIGGEWSVERLDRLARLYNLPFGEKE